MAAVENKEDSDDMLSLIRRTSDTFQRELEGLLEYMHCIMCLTCIWKYMGTEHIIPELETCIVFKCIMYTWGLHV